MLFIFVSLAGLPSTAGCGGTVGDGQTAVTGPGPDFGTGGGSTQVADASTPGSGGSGGATSGGTGGMTYRDPTCPPPTTTPGVYECDPFDLAACGAGNRCTPYVQYADDCGTEKIGTTCAVAGTGVQGDDCTKVTCAAGYVCATGGVGLECVKLCKPEGGAYACAPGLICSALDVDGFYVCD